MAKMRDIVVYSLLYIVIATEAARILSVYPVPSISHQVVFRPITLELIKHGHEVVVITADPMFPKGETPQNLTEIDVHDISYSALQNFLSISRGNKKDLRSQMKSIVTTIPIVVDAQLKTKEVQNLIKRNDTFDLLLIEAIIRPALAFSHIFKAPVIQVSSFGAVFNNYDVIGAPKHPFLYPNTFNQRLYNLSIFEKLYELHNNFMMDKFLREMEDEETKMIRKYFGTDTPSVRELQNNVDMLLLNVHPIWEGNRPVPPSVIYLGGLPQKPNKELPSDLKSYLDSSRNGVIYISFGTNVKSNHLSSPLIQMLVKVFSGLSFDVLWKWDLDELPGKSDNIKISKWLPQSDLLKHPKVKLFVTQGGQQSTDEAITGGVPMIGIPMLADQWYNVEKYVYHGIGIKLELEELNEESFSNAIKTVIGNESYRNNIIRLRTLMADQPMRPLERALWWIEHVLRHGSAKHLRAPAANITWAQYLELELVALILLVFLFLTSVSAWIAYSIYRIVSNKFVKSKVKSS